MPDNLKILKNLFAELERPLFLGDGLDKGEFHSLMQPGQFVSTNLREADGSDDMAIQASLTDDLIDTQFIYTPLMGSISEQYRLIIENAALPYKELSPKDQAEIDRINTWLAEKEPTYTVFAKYYYDALDAYSQEANSQNPSPGKVQILYEKVRTARNNWQTMGLRGQYEAKQARVIYLLSADPLSLWNRYRELLADHTKHSLHRGDYVQNFLIPPVSQWNAPGVSWSRFERTINESDTYDYSSSTSWGGGGSVGWGLWSVGGGASGGHSYSHSESDVSTVSIKFDYMRVRIDRRWLKSDIFGFRWWWWKNAFGYHLLSDGGNLHVTPPQRPIGIFPFLPTHMIVAKNVSIIANFSHNEATTIRNNLSASASVGWGPFSVKGSYAEANTTQTTHAEFDGTTLTIDQPQIIAFTGTLMPLSPNPDRTLPWQGDQAPFDPPASVVEAMSNIRDRESEALRELTDAYDAEDQARALYAARMKTYWRAAAARRAKVEADGEND